MSIKKSTIGLCLIACAVICVPYTILNDVQGRLHWTEELVVNHNQNDFRSANLSISASNRGRFYLCMALVGRLGNRMSQYASVYGIAKSQNRIPLLSSDDPIHRLFSVWAEKRPHQPGQKDICQGMKEHREKRAAAFDLETVTLPKTGDVSLRGYLQSFRYFKGYEEDIRQQFQLPDSLVREAREILTEQLATVLNPNSPRPKLVAVHVRIGDRVTARNVEFGLTVAPKEYILNAQRYFLNKYKNVIFVVCSDSMDWCLRNLPKHNTIFIQKHSVEVDFAVMRQCDDAIMTVGTLGWWVAWLTNGETVYYRKRVQPGSRVATQWNMSDHYPPHWIPML